ncbi:MAG: BglII/BstYI family type II restriction endonuclease [Roseiarcus sp.]
MRVAQVYSHMNGLEYLLVHRARLWEEIQAVIRGVDAEAHRVKESREKSMMGRFLYSPKHLNRSFDDAFTLEGWKAATARYWVTDDVALIRRTVTLPAEAQKQEILAAGKRAILSYNQTDFVKDRIAVEVQFGKYAFVAYDLFVKHMAFYVADAIDVGVEILPMKEMQSHMSSGPGYYEGELYNVIRQGRGVPAVPLVLIGVAS